MRREEERKLRRERGGNSDWRSRQTSDEAKNKM